MNEFMILALEQANEAMEQGEVPVGCIFVDSRTNKVIAKDRNRTNETLNGTRHAEFGAIDQVISMKPDAMDLEVYMKQVFSGVDVYVTVEPCIMCAAALRQVGVRSVVYGCANDKFGGCGSILSLHSPCDGFPGFQVIGGVFREDAILLLRRFYIQENGNAPEPKRKSNRVLKTDIPP